MLPLAKIAVHRPAMPAIDREPMIDFVFRISNAEDSEHFRPDFAVYSRYVVSIIRKAPLFWIIGRNAVGFSRFWGIYKEEHVSVGLVFETPGSIHPTWDSTGNISTSLLDDSRRRP